MKVTTNLIAVLTLLGSIAFDASTAIGSGLSNVTAAINAATHRQARTASERFLSPLGIGQHKTDTRDPFRGREIEPSSNRNRSIGRESNAYASDGGSGRYAPAEAMASDSGGREESDQLLKSARQALAIGDSRQARELVKKSHRLDVRYTSRDDTPDRVESLIDRYENLSHRGETAKVRREFAELMMEQSEGLKHWGDLAGAKYAAREAKRLSGGNVQLTRSAGTGQTIGNDSNRRYPDTARGSSSDVYGASDRVADTRTNQFSQANRLVRDARTALGRDDFSRAEALSRKAMALRVPATAYRSGDDRPEFVLEDLAYARSRAATNRRSGYSQPKRSSGDYPVRRSDYRLDRDRSRNSQVGFQQDDEAFPERISSDDTEPGKSQNAKLARQLFQQGFDALQAGDKATALRYFRQAYNYEADLDQATRGRLRTHLNTLSVGTQPRPLDRRPEGSDLDHAADRDRVQLNRMVSEVRAAQTGARRIRGTDPDAALRQLQDAYRAVADSNISEETKQKWLRSLDRSLAETDRFIRDNAADLNLNAQNRKVLQEVADRQKYRVEVDQRLADMTKEFNKLVKERRYPEARLLAMRGQELAPNNPTVELMISKVDIIDAVHQQYEIDLKKGRSIVLNGLDNIRAGTLMDPDVPMEFPPIEKWNAMTDRRSRYGRGREQFRTENEIAIERALKKPVFAKFKDQPLSTVVHDLGQAAGINVYIDPRALEHLNVPSSQTVTIDLDRKVMLGSALKLILNPLELTYIVEDEVLKITSHQRRNGKVIIHTYHVADLVIPIPNFVPTARMGISGSLREAYDRMGYSGPAGVGSLSHAGFASDASAPGGSMDPAVLASLTQPGSATGGAPAGGGYGPGGLGTSSEADFDSLIELITTTVDPPTWDEVGGPGSIQGFETNLTLVVSQTQDVHDKLVDLLNQLRRLQDLQVTIEVRFITLADDFYERIGVDFDFNIDDNVTQAQFLNAVTPPNEDSGPSITVGVGGDQTGNLFTPTTDLDIQFRQGSFGGTIPTIGGFDPSTAASFGFAILSDIEAYFFVQAAAGDTRSNVLQAPQVTLFNGQQAFVSDTAQRPFVTSVVPVVGDFAAAHQPVIVVLSEGTSLTIQAVVSSDRRFVRLTVVPFFSKIGNVETFTFNGSETTTTGSSATVDADDDSVSNSANNTTTTKSGTTVQLPTFEFVTVSTTVSVPDGGTVLLGGIKRMSEERIENGVPMLSNIPYINRLFKNVGIGRTTQTLMMMVTPRIIIQEEEEENAVGGGGQ